MELVVDDERPRVDIRALNTGLSIPPINTVKLSDLTVVKVRTIDLIGYLVSILDKEGVKHYGKVTEVEKEELFLEMDMDSDWVLTNVFLSIEDENQNLIKGTLII